MPDGRIVTLAPIGSRLLVFAPDGRPERSLGRQGQGPGELMAPAGMSRAGGDTLVVPDGSNRRINWVVSNMASRATNTAVAVCANSR